MVEAGIVTFAKFIRASLYLIAVLIGAFFAIGIIRNANDVSAPPIANRPVAGPTIVSDLPSLDDRNDRQFNSALAITARCINGAASMVAYSKEMRNFDYVQFKFVAMRVCVPGYAANMKAAWPSLNQKQLTDIYEGLVGSTVPEEKWNRIVQQASRGYGR